jgi:hypothetical protein
VHFFQNEIDNFASLKKYLESIDEFDETLIHNFLCIYYCLLKSTFLPLGLSTFFLGIQGLHEQNKFENHCF